MIEITMLDFVAYCLILFSLWILITEILSLWEERKEKTQRKFDRRFRYAKVVKAIACETINTKRKI